MLRAVLQANHLAGIMEGGLGIREDKRVGLQAVLTVTGQSGAGKVLSGVQVVLLLKHQLALAGWVISPFPTDIRHSYGTRCTTPQPWGEEYTLEYVKPRTVI